MCGIIGYIGRKPAQNVILEGLRRLEYRGYDSSGLCIINDKDLSNSARRAAASTISPPSSPNNPPKAMSVSATRVGDARPPHRRQCPPAPGPVRQIALVHNGVIENHLLLKERLLAKAIRSPPRPTPKCSPTSSASIMRKSMRTSRAPMGPRSPKPFVSRSRMWWAPMASLSSMRIIRPDCRSPSRKSAPRRRGARREFSRERRQRHHRPHAPRGVPERLRNRHAFT